VPIPRQARERHRTDITQTEDTDSHGKYLSNLN
jgi:hypothetical protein